MEKQQRIEIGDRIRGLRNASSETNRSISDYVGVGERSVANWIAGDTGITYDNAKKVAELFDVDVRWLWDGRDRGLTPEVLDQLSESREAQLDRIEERLQELNENIVRLLTPADIAELAGEEETARELRAAEDAAGPAEDEDDGESAESGRAS